MHCRHSYFEQWVKRAILLFKFNLYILIIFFSENTSFLRQKSDWVGLKIYIFYELVFTNLICKLYARVHSWLYLKTWGKFGLVAQWNYFYLFACRCYIYKKYLTFQYNLCMKLVRIQFSITDVRERTLLQCSIKRML